MSAEMSTILDAFNMFQTQYSQVDKLWNYFGIFSLAVAGFTIGSEKASKTIWEPIIIVIGYLTFCCGNYKALIDGHSFLFTLATKYNERAKPLGLDGLEILSVSKITAFYVLVVVTFTLGIILVSMSRLKNCESS